MTDADDRRRVAVSAVHEAIERARTFSGWTFTGLDVVHLDPRIPWDYEARARELVSGSRRVLDLGTGGGERLSRIIHGAEARVVATEEWQPNVRVSGERLRPLGVDVICCESARLPSADATFDLVLDRHEALDPSEVARVLAPGGTVLTQQVGHEHWPELRRFFPQQARFGDHFNGYQRGFAAAGLIIDEVRTHEERVGFRRLADLVFMLLVSPWEIPGFDPLGDVDALIAAEDALRTEQGIVLSESHYLLRAHRPL